MTINSKAWLLPPQKADLFIGQGVKISSSYMRRIFFRLDRYGTRQFQSIRSRPLRSGSLTLIEVWFAASAKQLTLILAGKIINIVLKVLRCVNKRVIVN